MLSPDALHTGSSFSLPTPVTFSPTTVKECNVLVLGPFLGPLSVSTREVQKVAVALYQFCGRPLESSSDIRVLGARVLPRGCTDFYSENWPTLET